MLSKSIKIDQVIFNGFLLFKLTGTPGGVGFTRKPPEFLKIGDIIQSRIESIGILKNKIIKEPLKINLKSS